MGQFCCRSSHDRRQCRWNTWPQNNFLLVPAADISSRQIMHTPSERCRSSAVASGKRSSRAVTWQEHRKDVDNGQTATPKPTRSHANTTWRKRRKSKWEAENLNPTRHTTKHTTSIPTPTSAPPEAPRTAILT